MIYSIFTSGRASGKGEGGNGEGGPDPPVLLKTGPVIHIALNELASQEGHASSVVSIA